jgi:hypothetical protein
MEEKMHPNRHQRLRQAGTGLLILSRYGDHEESVVLVEDEILVKPQKDGDPVGIRDMKSDDIRKLKRLGWEWSNKWRCWSYRV